MVFSNSLSIEPSSTTGKSLKWTELTPVFNFNDLNIQSEKNGANGLINFVTVAKQVYNVSYAAFLSSFISPFQKRRRDNLTYQLLKSSPTKSSIALAAGVGS